MRRYWASRYYPTRSYYLRDYPQDDAEYGIMYPNEHGELQYYDGATIQGLMKYANHASLTSGGRPNAAFYYTEDSPFVKLQLLRPVEMNEEILVDYRENYPYKARKFRR